MIQKKHILSIALILLFFFLAGYSLSLHAQERIWTSISNKILPIKKVRQFDSYRLFQLNTDLFLKTTNKVGKEFSKSAPFLRTSIA